MYVRSNFSSLFLGLTFLFTLCILSVYSYRDGLVRQERISPVIKDIHVYNGFASFNEQSYSKFFINVENIDILKQNLLSWEDNFLYRMDNEKNILNVHKLFLANIPNNLASIKDVKKRKELFFSILLSNGILVNYGITKDRIFLKNLKSSSEEQMTEEQKIELNRIKRKYSLEKVQSVANLLDRIDIVPLSLILSQAAIESGWGSSRFAKEGNALFGEWTFDSTEKGIIPNNRIQGATHRIKSFDNIYESILSYAKIFMRSDAYVKFRELRRKEREKNSKISGLNLAYGLSKYSGLKDDYIYIIRDVINKNNLDKLDDNLIINLL